MNKKNQKKKSMADLKLKNPIEESNEEKQAQEDIITFNSPNLAVVTNQFKQIQLNEIKEEEYQENGMQSPEITMTS